MIVNHKKPFFIRLIANSTEPGLVIIRKIETTGTWCPLRTLSQYACEKLSCTFRETFCEYTTEVNSRANVLFKKDAEGKFQLFPENQPLTSIFTLYSFENL